MTKNERAFGIWLIATPLKALQAGAVACKATDYATLLGKAVTFVQGLAAHPLTEENDVYHDHLGSDHD